MEMEGKETHLVSNSSHSNQYIYRTIKRCADIVISLVALICLSPVFFAIWAIDTFSNSNRGPVFYKQERVGYHGKKFGMYKFRSMIMDADKKLYKNKELYQKYVDNNYKLAPEDDPRITRFGRILRKSSIDEIPQFINILLGDMSLVGPRPVIEPELIEYDEYKLLSVKPGAMGLWQASGRSNVGYPERANIEEYYVSHISFGMDCKIVYGNFKSIFFGKGAY